MDGVERVDEHLRAVNRQPGGDAALAKSGDDVGFGDAGEARLGQPGAQLGEESFVHLAIIRRRAPAVLAGFVPLTAS